MQALAVSPYAWRFSEALCRGPADASGSFFFVSVTVQSVEWRVFAGGALGEPLYPDAAIDAWSLRQGSAGKSSKFSWRKKPVEAMQPLGQVAEVDSTVTRTLKIRVRPDSRKRTTTASVDVNFGNLLEKQVCREELSLYVHYRARALSKHTESTQDHLYKPFERSPPPHKSGSRGIDHKHN